MAASLFLRGLACLLAALWFPCGAYAQAVTATVLSDGFAGTHYVAGLITVCEECTPLTYTLASGSLPPGLQLSSPSSGACVLQGTPATAGVFQFTIVGVGSGSTDTELYTIRIQQPGTPFAFDVSSLPGAVQYTPYEASYLVTGGTPPYHFTVVPGFVSLSIDLYGDLLTSRVIDSAGNHSFTVYAQDSSMPTNYIQQAFTLTVLPGIDVESSNLGYPAVDEIYAVQFTASGGAAPYTFAVTSGSLPPGLTLAASTGWLEGAPTLGGNYNFQITATDSNGKTGYNTFTVTVAAPVFLVSATGPLVGYPGVPCSFALSVPGGTPPYTFSTAPGQPLPTGWTLSGQGVLAGTPASGVGQYTFDIRVTDSTGNYNDYGIGLAVYDIGPATLLPAWVGAAYSESFGTYGFNYTSMALISGSLPPGLKFVTTPQSGSPPKEVIQGTPTQAGSYTFTISATGATGQKATRTYTLTVAATAGPSGPSVTTGTYRGWVGETFNLQLSGPSDFTVTEGALPPGLTLTAATGVISGVPTVAGTYYFTVPVTTNEQVNPIRGAFTIQIFAAHLAIAPDTIPAAVVGQNYSVTFTLSGGTPPYSCPSGGVAAPGLFFNQPTTNTAIFTVAGTPTLPGAYAIQIAAMDSGGNYVSRSYSLTVTGVAVNIQPLSLPAFQWDVPYSLQLTASGGAPPYVFRAACLPGGISLSAGGLISGTPTGLGGSPCLVTVRDSGDGSGQISYAINYGSPVFTLSPLALSGGQAGIAYYGSIDAAAAATPVQFTISNGSLPPGLTTTVWGGAGDMTISGTPTITGSFPFLVTATDASAHSVSLNYSIVIANQAVVIAPAALPSGAAGVPYSMALTASGGAPAYTYSVSSGSLPAGLTLNSSTGLIAGVPTSATLSSFQIEAVDSSGAKGFWSYQMTPAPATLTVTSSLPAGQLGVAYSGSFHAYGGTAPYSFSLSAGSLPAGLTFSSSGQISGTPQRAGGVAITVTALDANGAAGFLSCSLYIAGNTLTVGPATLPTAYAGQPYSTQLNFSGGTAPYQITGYSAGMWPSLQIGTSGAITGTPWAGGGPYYLTLQFTDAIGSYGSGTVSLSVLDLRPSPTISSSTLPAGSIGSPYSATIQASGGTPPYTFAGASPDFWIMGLTLSASGALSGTPLGGVSPPTGAPYNIRVGVYDSAGLSATATLQVPLSSATIAVGPAALPNANAGQPYSAQLTASGGKPPYYFQFTSSTVSNCPLQMAADGVIAGTPTTASCGPSFQFSAWVTDANLVQATATFQIAIGSTLYVPAQDFPAGRVGVPYSAALTAAGGKAPYSWSVVSGALPAGMTLASTGAISGTPTNTGNATFTVQATDTAGAKATAVLGITVLSFPSIVTASLAAGMVGTAYSQTVSASGGAPPYTWSLVSGALPVGLTLSAAGAISGTPVEQGVFRLSLQAMDLTAAAATANINLTIAPSPLSIISASPLPPAAIGAPYSQSLMAFGGSPPYAWSVISGALAGGLTLSIDGTLSGAPLAEGGFSFTVKAEDSVSGTATAALALKVTAPTVITTVAGGGTPLTPVAATSASLGEPLGIAADSSGNVYFTSLQDVFKVDGTGTLTLLAGTGLPGYSGDGGLAAGASLSFPNGLALDGSGNLYIADTGNNRVREISAAGVITTVAGNGVRGYSGDGGAAGSAELNSPTSIALGASGNLYIDDFGNGLIRKVSSGGVITTVIGITVPNLAVDESENMYVAEPACECVAELSPSLNATLLAGGGSNFPGDGGPATSALLELLGGIALDPSGDLYIATAGNIRKVSPAGIINTVAGDGAPGYSGDGGAAISAQVNRPSAIALDGLGNLYIADTYNGRIRKVRPDGSILTVAGSGDSAYSGDGGQGASARLFHPTNAAVDGSGNLYIADAGNNRVRKVSVSGVISTFAGTGAAGASGEGGQAMAAQLNGDSGNGGQATAAQLNGPTAVVVDGTGNVYIADSAAVRKVAPGGTVSNLAGTGIAGYSGDGGPATAAQLNGPSGMALDAAGDLFIADTNNGRVREVTPAGLISTVAGAGGFGYSGDGGAATSAEIGYPTGVAVDPAGNLYIAQGVVRKVAPGGAISTVESEGNVTGVAVDASGSVYLAYRDAHQVNKTYPSGVSTGVAGDGVQGYSGDDGVGTAAALWSPNSVTVDAAGDVYVTDSAANTVRRVALLNPLSMVTVGPLARGATGVVYAQPLAAAGGLPPYAWSVAAGALPAGLTLSAAGAISGAPTAAGVFSFTVQVADSASLTASRAFAIPVTAGALAVVASPPLPPGAVGVAYSQTLSDSGGTPPDTSWAVTSGALPPGLSLNASGALSGTPTSSGAYSFTAKVTDSAGATASASFQLTITLSTYVAGDVAPYTSDWAPNFGDGALNIMDLIQELFAVNNVPGFRPAACSDRFDALDGYPADTASARGGDGVLDIRDLILELFRVNNLDMLRPMRATMGGALPWAACVGGASGSSTGVTAVKRRPVDSPALPPVAEAVLVVGQSESAGVGQERIPIYIEARQDLVRIAITFALGDRQTQLSFTPAPETPPSLVQDSQLGVVVVAWLNGISLPAGQLRLLGYVVAPVGAAGNLSLYGASASRLDDGRVVALRRAQQ